MVRPVAVILAVAVLTALGGCAEQSSPRCEAMCVREAECTEALRDKTIEFHRAECVRACTELDREPGGKRFVSAHALCIDAAADDCDRILACD